MQSFRGEGGASGGKKLRVAINGFGRIGRNFVRCLESRGPDAPMEIVALNDSGGVKQATHLLKCASRRPRRASKPLSRTVLPRCLVVDAVDAASCLRSWNVCSAMYGVHVAPARVHVTPN